MNLLLTIVLCTSVLIQFIIGAKQNTPQNETDENGWVREKTIKYSEGMSKKRSSKRHSHKKPHEPYVITEVRYKGKTVYKCNGQIFHNLNDANECLRKLNRKDKRPTPPKPPRPNRPEASFPQLKPSRPAPPPPIPSRPADGPLQPSRPAPPPPIPPRPADGPLQPSRPAPSPPIQPRPEHRPYKPSQQKPRPARPKPTRRPPHQGPHINLQNQLEILHNRQKQLLAQKYRSFKITKYLSKDRFSNRIFKSVWSDCDYICYFEIGFSNYKSRALTQINIYRVYHKVHILKENSQLNKLAQNLADKMADRKTLLKVQSSLYGIVVGMSYYPAASVLVTKWYDENSRYRYHTKGPIYGTQSFTQMVWKNTKYVGLGVAKKGDLLFVACFYFPRGNVYGQYRRNVLRRKFTWFGR
uniref:SCP domain-containing protein n=1 Tax=Strongyloides papillosus TaxID=174720 RepID=A0A0N5BMB7_STREA